MLEQGPAKKVTVYVGEAVRHKHEPVYVAVLNYLFYHGVSGATVIRGAAGFGADHQLQMARFVDTSLNLPVKIEFVEAAEKVDEILPKLLEIVEDGLVEVHATEIVKAPHAVAAPPGPAVTLRGKAKLMRIFLGEQDKWRDKPLYDAILESLRAHDIAGATVYRGICGYGAQSRIHKEKRMRLSSDLPIMISVIDEESRMRVPAHPRGDARRWPRGALRSGRHQVHATDRAVAAAEGGAMTLSGAARMVRIHIGEDDRWQGKPLYEAIVEEACRKDIAGATVFRGIEGYGASSRIHRRQLLTSADLPVMVCLIDRADAIDRFLPILDLMVSEGLVAISDVEVIRYTPRRGSASTR